MQQPAPTNYTLRLEPDLDHFTFIATAEIRMSSQTAVEEISLNILEIAIWTCSVLVEDNYVNCPFLVNNPKETLRIFLPHAMQDEIVLRIEYQGLINDKMAGFYRSQYTTGKATRFIAVTQFEESDARRAFPCMDHPADKATFDIVMDIDRRLVAISNTAVKKEHPLENGKKRVFFEQTPIMSTYLVFFGVGEFEIVQDVEDPRVRVVTLPGMQKYARYGLAFGRKSLQYSEAYYGIGYPLSKMDLIAIPDFAFGAMENWGAITFRENLLLHYPQITSKSGEERICEVIAHEIAHQWFGNLVTPSDWKYLWLNESFATYFGFGVVDHYYPQWDTWEQFLHGQTGSAMARDSLHETFAIEIPGGEHIVINSSTAPIIYNKGASILRQIQGYIGDDNFRKGLQHYLKTYEYACADSHHLWESFEKASNQPISTMMKSWIEQPGFPIVDVKRSGNQLTLAQQRFTYLPNESAQYWVIPVTIDLISDNNTARRITVLMDEADKTISLPEDTAAYKLNARHTGFFRTHYRDTQNLKQLGKRVEDQTLPAEDRWGLENDLYALVKNGRKSLDDYLKFLLYYKNEDAYLPLTSIASNLSSAFLTVKDDRKDRITALAIPWFEKILDTIGYDPNEKEKHTISILRDKLIWDAGLYGSKKAVEFSKDRFRSLIKGDGVHPDIMRSVMQVGALTGGDDAFDWLDQRFQSSQIEHDRMNILIALGCFKKPDLIKRSLQYVLDAVAPRNKFIPVVAMASNPYAVPLMWEWFVSNLDQIEQFHPMLYERVIGAIIPASGLQNADTVNTFFNEYMQKTDKAKDVIKLSLEKLEINLRLRDAN